MKMRSVIIGFCAARFGQGIRRKAIQQKLYAAFSAESQKPTPCDGRTEIYFRRSGNERVRFLSFRPEGTYRCPHCVCCWLTIMNPSEEGFEHFSPPVRIGVSAAKL